ncbi:MAG: hypothetical protein AAGA60_02540 [Cyanobacteria bacterium P01_E01_bin.42]
MANQKTPKTPFELMVKALQKLAKLNNSTAAIAIVALVVIFGMMSMSLNFWIAKGSQSPPVTEQVEKL